MAIGSDTVGPMVLTCWKDIARYVGKGVRTVQRWEQIYGLPVHRPLGVAGKSSVIAHPRDLDKWLEERWSDRAHGKAGFEALPNAPLRDIDLSAQIRTSQELRLANQTLVHEIRAVLNLLVQNCIRLTPNQAEDAITPNERLSQPAQSSDGSIGIAQLRERQP